MASAAAAIANFSNNNNNNQHSSATETARPKIEPVAASAKIIHPDDDISLVSHST